MMTYYLKLIIYLALLGPGDPVPNGAVVYEQATGIRGVIVTDWSPGAEAFVMGGILPDAGPTKADCEKFGNWARQEEAKRLKLKDFRQLKFACTLAPKVY